ncbi:Tyrosine-protein kinase Abl [Trichinella pseudospiralis]
MGAKAGKHSASFASHSSLKPVHLPPPPCSFPDPALLNLETDVYSIEEPVGEPLNQHSFPVERWSSNENIVNDGEQSPPDNGGQKFVALFDFFGYKADQLTLRKGQRGGQFRCASPVTSVLGQSRKYWPSAFWLGLYKDNATIAIVEE